MKIKALLGCIAVVFSLPGCSGPKQEACWSPETKQMATSLVRSVILEHIEGVIKAGGVEINDERHKNIDQRTKVELTDFFIAGVDKEVEHLTCGATVHFTLNRPDNKVVQGESLISFDIHKGENGQYYSVSKGTLIQLVNDSE